MESESTRLRPKAFLSTPASARRMTDPSASPLAGLESAVERPKSDRPAAVVSGESARLGRSVVFGVREGHRPEAESSFRGMLAEGKERKRAGDVLYRAALEDMGEGGRKLVVAVKSWQHAHPPGFKEAG